MSLSVESVNSFTLNRSVASLGSHALCPWVPEDRRMPLLRPRNSWRHLLPHQLQPLRRTFFCFISHRRRPDVRRAARAERSGRDVFWRMRELRQVREDELPRTSVWWLSPRLLGRVHGVEERFFQSLAEVGPEHFEEEQVRRRLAEDLGEVLRRRRGGVPGVRQAVGNPRGTQALHNLRRWRRRPQSLRQFRVLRGRHFCGRILTRWCREFLGSALHSPRSRLYKWLPRFLLRRRDLFSATRK